MLIDNLDRSESLSLIDLISQPVFAGAILSVFVIAFMWQHVQHAERSRSACLKHAGTYLIYAIINIGAMLVLTDVVLTFWSTRDWLNILMINLGIIAVLCLVSIMVLMAVWSLNRNRDVAASRSRLSQKGAKDHTASILVVVSLLMLWSYFSDENIMTGVSYSPVVWSIQIGSGLLLSLCILLTVSLTRKLIRKEL